MNRPRIANLEPRTSNLRRAGFTLLEVILALAILAGSMAVLGQLVSMGMANARKAENMTRAVIAAESIMAEIVSGARSPTTDGGSIEDENGEFTSMGYDVVIEPTDHGGMLNVIVNVESYLDAVEPVSCTLERWVIDPDYAASLSETTTN